MHFISFSVDPFPPFKTSFLLNTELQLSNPSARMLNKRRNKNENKGKERKKKKNQVSHEPDSILKFKRMNEFLCFPLLPPVNLFCQYNIIYYSHAILFNIV